MVAGVALPQNPNSAPFRFSLGYHNITIPGDRSHHAPVPKHVIIDRDKDDNEYYTRQRTVLPLDAPYLGY